MACMKIDSHTWMYIFIPVNDHVDVQTFKTFNQDISMFFCCKTCDLNLKGKEYYEFVCF